MASTAVQLHALIDCVTANAAHHVLLPVEAEPKWTPSWVGSSSSVSPDGMPVYRHIDIDIDMVGVITDNMRAACI